MTVLKPDDKLEIEGELNQTCDDDGVRGASVGDLVAPTLTMSKEVYDWVDDTINQDGNYTHSIQVRVTIEILAVEVTKLPW